MTIWASLAAIIQAWPETIKFINRLADAAEKIQKVIKEQNLNQFLEDLDKTIHQVENAKSLQERVDAAKALSNLVRRLG